MSLTEEAIQHIMERTCVRFIPRTNQTHYLNITSQVNLRSVITVFVLCCLPIIRTERNGFQIPRACSSYIESTVLIIIKTSKSSQWRCFTNYLFCSFQEAKIRRLNIFEEHLLKRYLAFSRVFLVENITNLPGSKIFLQNTSKFFQNPGNDENATNYKFSCRIYH